MPQLYHTVPRQGIRHSALALPLLIEDEISDLLVVFLEYEVQGEKCSLRLFPVDGYRGEERYSLYSAEIPAAHLAGERFSYRFSVEGEYTRTYEFPLEEGDIPDGVVEVPAILPLGAAARFYLSQGDLRLRFFVFPWDIDHVCVSVLEKGEWHNYDAALSENGEWECVLPTALLNELGGKLLCFVEATGQDGGALLGNAREPLSIRLVDDAGPLLTDVFPVDGETVAENPPEIHMAFVDASGVDSNASALYLDGKNVSKDAVWTANGMSFRPKKPLDCGEHILEIDLRDSRGSRTYRRVAFHAECADGAQGGEGKKPRSSVRVVGFLANALLTLKKIFTDKE